MTESVSTPRSRSRSTRSSARSRPRSAAAAGSTSAKATARSGSAPAGDAPRDERTLDLFGDPVLEPGERMPVTAHEEALVEADAAAVADDGRQATLDGFVPPADAVAATHAEAEGTAAQDGAVEAVSVSTPEGDVAANVDGASAEGLATQAADSPAVDGGVTQIDVPAVDRAANAETKLQAADGAAAQAAESPAANGEVAKPVVEAAVVKSREGKSSGDAVKERRASSGSKRRVAAGANEAAATPAAPVATSVDSKPEADESNPPPVVVAPVEPQTPAQSAQSAQSVRPLEPAIATPSAKPRDTTPQPDASPSPVAQPAVSAASFVTKPSSERPQPPAPAFDPDTHLRPLTDRLAALQSDVDGLTRSADREMRRVNRLLLALAVVVLVGLVALVLQTRQIAHLKQDVATQQQRIDRLAADLSTQQATLMTLEEHHEALLSQVDRLQRNANREAAVAKRVRRTR
ncbi:flagellar hook-length control protein FliK [Burkholderia orbicola]|uniref:Flagellar hook-length control protein FliK n=2 Tax=Burkholderia cepacia complex TaxID=87882 RepID=A0A3R9C6H9_9BURK|nr:MULTISPECIES: flagellar hook-length control protein FliK [Burkholderia cepacia complex]AQQ25783.1 flagellar hook-length control protein FliK [Burkholderia cenocepacia]MDN7525757.1 flagellar hook-length control protein FliK [Burkholderia orbicola]MDN7775417.1 flagellar hook-length control protein FliK [Burkholderia orbicola]MDN7991353.1 flagellar hook-length control protein FliK [Burkholderia orbicola]ONV92989.1 flagellar hook-length control protein FliK [Burkholderia cenocepacia]